MNMGRVGMVFATAAMLVVLLAVGASAQTCPANCPATCPAPTVAPSHVGSSQGMAMPEVMPEAASPPLLDYASLWHSGGPVRSFTGRIESVDQFYPSGQASAPGTKVRVRLTSNDTESIPDWQLGGYPAYRMVLLGPSWYVQQHFPRLRRGELITVNGVPAIWHGRQIVVAQDITVNERYLAFRTTSGEPVWGGGWQAWAGPSHVAVLPVMAATPIARYDSSTVETVNGHLEHVWSAEINPGAGRSQLISIRRPDDTVLRVALAPAAFLGGCNIPIRTGDPVTVTGSLVTFEGQPLLLASQFEQNGLQYALRDSSGNPSWPIASAPVPIASAPVEAMTAPSPGGAMLGPQNDAGFENY